MVTFVPEQIVVPGNALMLTDGVRYGKTVMPILLLLDVTGDAQLAVDVIVHRTVS